MCFAVRRTARRVKREPNLDQKSGRVKRAKGIEPGSNSIYLLYMLYSIYYQCMADNTATEDTGRYVNVLFDETLLADIDEFRFDHRFESRTAAIRWLLRAALDKNLKPKAAAKK